MNEGAKHGFITIKETFEDVYDKNEFSMRHSFNFETKALTIKDKLEQLGREMAPEEQKDVEVGPLFLEA